MLSCMMFCNSFLGDRNIPSCRKFLPSFRRSMKQTRPHRPDSLGPSLQSNSKSYKEDLEKPSCKEDSESRPAARKKQTRLIWRGGSSLLSCLRAVQWAPGSPLLCADTVLGWVSVMQLPLSHFCSWKPSLSRSPVSNANQTPRTTK